MRDRHSGTRRATQVSRDSGVVDVFLFGVKVCKYSIYLDLPSRCRISANLGWV